jgi:phosphatidate phosphatase APP1
MPLCTQAERQFLNELRENFVLIEHKGEIYAEFLSPYPNEIIALYQSDFKTNFKDIFEMDIRGEENE